nr:hypothetical protein [Tanacetum cinerariifolium]
MYDELLNGSFKVVSKSSVVSAADAPYQRQQPTTPLNNHTTPAPTCQNLSITSSVTSNENITQAEPHAENDQVADDEFINIFSTPVQDQGETSSRHVDSSNMHTFYQRYPFEQHWIKDHPLEQVIGNPSQSVRTRRQLESDAEMCMFALTELETFEALEHKSIVVESNKHKVVVFTKAPPQAYGELFLRFSTPYGVDGQGAWDAKLNLAYPDREPSIVFGKDFLVTTKCKVDFDMREVGDMDKEVVKMGKANRDKIPNVMIFINLI